MKLPLQVSELSPLPGRTMLQKKRDSDESTSLHITVTKKSFQSFRFDVLEGNPKSLESLDIPFQLTAYKA